MVMLDTNENARTFREGCVDTDDFPVPCGDCMDLAVQFQECGLALNTVLCLGQRCVNLKAMMDLQVHL